MKIAGFKKQSLIDYPGNISSVVFTQGCNFRCPYCHNPNLVLPEQFETCYEEEELFPIGTNTNIFLMPYVLQEANLAFTKIYQTLSQN